MGMSIMSSFDFVGANRRSSPPSPNMPVTFRPSQETQIARYWDTWNQDPNAILKILRNRKDPQIDELLASPLVPQSASTGTVVSGFAVRKNGLVHTIVDAYNRHHALVLRPDDIWLCILTQFSLFVNGEGRAEELRSVFVAHEGKKELTIVSLGSRYTVDFGGMAKRMTELIDENVSDPTLREWIIPNFTTTTHTDVVAASVIMMATLQAYFDYKTHICCGLPYVTLLGEKADWDQIVQRIEKLKEYGPETTAWYHLLKPVVTRFPRAFEDGYAESPENREFWNRVVHWKSGGSGPTYLSGWVTAFCVFDEKGKWMGGDIVSEAFLICTVVRLLSSSQDIEEDQEALETIVYNDPGRDPWSKPNRVLVLDGIAYHTVNAANIPPAFAEVPVTLDDNGITFPVCFLLATLTRTDP